MKKLMEMTPYELGESGREEAVKYLIMYLSSNNGNNRRLAASAISKLSERYRDTCQRALPYLIENLSDSHAQVRQYTIKALMKLNIPKQYHKLIYDISRNDNMEYNRRAASELLDKCNADKTIDKPVQENNNRASLEFLDKFSIKQVSDKEQKFIDMLNKHCGIRLTEKQKSAVLHKDGPALVLAVPGAGKTTVLLARTANLIINHGINPASILSITFSKASAADMKNRYYAFFKDITSIEANFFTIHSFCFELIKKYSIIKNIRYNIIEEGNGKVNKKLILRELFKKYNGENIDDDTLADLINSISYVKNMMYNEKEIEEYSLKLDIRYFKEIFSSYEEIKRGNNFLDYDDMLTTALNILMSDEDILQRYRNLYNYIQIDEGQDTSKVQHKVIELIARPNNNVFVVADDDQSIYSFRGAHPKFLLEFDQVYSGTAKYFIEQNFRSTPEIINLANNFIKNNVERFNKELNTKNASGAPVKMVRVNDEAQEVEYILKQIENVGSNKESAILYRNNISAIRLADELSRRGVSFYIRDYNQFFFKHFILEDIRCFILFTQDYRNIEAFKRIYYRIASFISKDTAHKIVMAADGKRDVFSIGESLAQIGSNQQAALIRFNKIFDFMKYKQPYDFINYIDRDLGYSKYLKDNCINLGYSYESLRVILSNLKSLAVRCRNFTDFIERLVELEKTLEESKRKKGTAHITLSTIHSSKGLEFYNVFLVDLIDNILPTRASIESYESGSIEELEEERRLMYVALTRAKYNLHLVTLNSKNEEAVKPSRFISEVISNA